MAGGKVLILGGIRSGKSAFAETLLKPADQVRYVATAEFGDERFAERVAAHQFRRPASWQTVEPTGGPAALVETIAQADPQWPLLIDDLGAWATGLLGRHDANQLVSHLAEAVRTCPAQIVLVSPEVGLSVVPGTESGNMFADLVGELNQAVAAVCDDVALVVAGQPSWLKKGAQAAPRLVPVAAVPARAPAIPDDTSDLRSALTGTTRALPIVVTGMTIRPGMDLPIHDDEARSAAERHLSTLEISGSGLGTLEKVVIFAAGTQGRAVPSPWQQPHMLLLNGTHEGDLAAGDDVRVAARTAQATRRGEGAIGLLAAQIGVKVKVVETPTSGDIVYGRAADAELIESMLTEGWRLTDEAVDAGADLIILGSCGAGADAAAAALVSKITGAEIAGLLARVVGPDGSVDDNSWMLRCAAVRDALHRSRNCDLSANTLLSELGGADFALAAGVILGATARRTPVMVDGPLGTAAGLVARDLGSQSRLWSTMPDHGGHPTTKAAADVIGMQPLLDLKTGLGEGAASLLALPMLNSALTLASTLDTKPPVLAAPPGFESPLVD